MSSSVEVQDEGDSRTSGLGALRQGLDRVCVTLTGTTSCKRDASCTDGKDPFCYHMDHKKRGHFIIINNENFREQTKLETRTGTRIDANYLKEDFRKLGFTVTIHNDLTAAEMLRVMINVAAQDHSDCDCFGMAVLTHGDNSVVFGVDDLIYVDSLVQPVKSCQSLAGKPKIFIIQACRGNKLMEGVEMHDGLTFGKQKARLIPLEADFLYAYSTVPGYYSWRNQANGSWFVQALHKMMQKYILTLDFVSLLTRVNYEVAYEFESRSRNPAISEKKQVPSIVSMLTKDLYFKEKRA